MAKKLPTTDEVLDPDNQLAEASITFLDMLASADNALTAGDIDGASQAVCKWLAAADLLCCSRQDLKADRLPLVLFRKTAERIASRVLVEARKPKTIERWQDAGLLYPIGDAIDREAREQADAARGVVELIELDNDATPAAKDGTTTDKTTTEQSPVPVTAHHEGKKVEWITPSEAAYQLDKDVTTVRRHCKNKTWPCHNARLNGKRWEIPKTDIEASRRFRRPQ